MSKIIVFGSHGKVGQHVIRLLAQSNRYQATAVVRNAEQTSTIKNLCGANPNIAVAQTDIGISSVAEIAEIIRGNSAVVISVGSAGRDLLKVDLDGVVKLFEATVRANVRRLILVSAVYAHDREFGAASPLKDYYIAKYYADRILRNEFKDSLDFTILKPSRLSDGAGTGKIRILRGEKDVGLVDRIDVARVILELVDKNSSFGQEYDFSLGDSSINKGENWQ